ncbi:MAG: efflux RND transporter periplasmic adaptor subunit [Chitinophagaceae bacterium]|nr:efflux RND transporter periplasmic adaptor subunit [Chitinophagaceae bacterium]
MNRIIYLFTFASLLILSSCSSKNKKEAVNVSDSVVLVSVASPSGNKSNELNISGQIEAAQTVNISTRLMGYITMLKVKVGDRVNKGQLLVTINNDDILAKRAQADAQIAEAEAAVKSAQKDQERFTNLYKQQSASAKELDNMTLQFNSAKSRLEAAKQMRNEVNAMLHYAQLYAPFSGIVTQKMADAGSMANPGMPILTIEQAGALQVSATVPESAIQHIKLGTEAVVHIQSIEKTFKTNINQINPSSQFTGGQFIVKLQVPEPVQKGLYAGMYTNISIPLQNNNQTSVNEQMVLVPASVIEYKNQLTGLYTISNTNKALLRWVRLGKTYGDKIEVLSGLEKNESFISSADGKLYNGVSVKIK